MFSGAGMSASAGIPDFRSDGGIYDRIREEGLSAPEQVFDIELFKRNPSVFYKFSSLLYAGD